MLRKSFYLFFLFLLLYMMVCVPHPIFSTLISMIFFKCFTLFSNTIQLQIRRQILVQFYWHVVPIVSIFYLFFLAIFCSFLYLFSIRCVTIKVTVFLLLLLSHPAFTSNCGIVSVYLCICPSVRLSFYTSIYH